MMIKVKKSAILILLGLMALSSSAHAVIDPEKVAQITGRNVQATIEVIKNMFHLMNQMQENLLQGPIGKVGSQQVTQGAMPKFETFVPAMDSDIQSVMGDKGYDAIPNLRNYVQDKMTSIDVSDVIGQNDALLAVNERLNLSSLDVLKTAKATSALSNEAPKEANDSLGAAADAPDLRSKGNEEAAVNIKSVQNAIQSNQLISQLLETKAQEGLALQMRASVSKTVEKASDAGSSALKEISG